MATAVGRSALDVEDDTSLTTFLDDSSSSASSQARCRSTCKRWRCCKITCMVLVVLLALLGIVVGINISQRSRLLEPMLQLLTQETSFCHAPARGTCVAELSDESLRRYDLHPPAAEKALMGFMYVQVAQRQPEIMREILSGAHLVLLKDQVESMTGPISAYQMLEHWPGAYKRMSSHRSDAQQYGIPQGEVLHTILLGKIGGKTWFQFEGNGVNGVLTFILHMCDYVEYKLTGRNIGPLGTSKHTDRSPLLIQLPVAMKKQECPVICNKTGPPKPDPGPFAESGNWLFPRLL